MAVDECTRHELHPALDQVLGADHAAALMEHLLPTGRGDVVTREYLDVAFRAQDGRFDRLEGAHRGLGASGSRRRAE